jgi:hypothetical protein
MKNLDAMAPSVVLQVLGPLQMSDSLSPPLHGWDLYSFHATFPSRSFPLGCQKKCFNHVFRVHEYRGSRVILGMNGSPDTQCSTLQSL